MANELKGMDPEVIDLVSVSALITSAASMIVNVRDSRVTNEELFIDLLYPSILCERAMVIGQNVISKLSGRLHETTEEALVVTGMVHDHLLSALAVFEQIEEEKKNPKETTKGWTDGFGSSEELQEKFGKKGLKAYITFKKKCLEELPFKISAGAHKAAGGYCQKLQEVGHRLSVRALEYQDDLDRGVVSKDDDNRETISSEDRIIAAQAVKEYETSRATLKRDIDDGNITTYRREGKGKTAKHIFSRTELEKWYGNRKQPLK